MGFQLESGARLPVVPARARARVLPIWYLSGILQAFCRLPGSTLSVDREHARGCLGAQCVALLVILQAFCRLPGSALSVARRHARGCLGARCVALPAILHAFCRHSAGCLGARSRLPGSTFREHDLALPSTSGIIQVAREHISGCPGARDSSQKIYLMGS